MKDNTTHRKRTKSESDSGKHHDHKDHKDGHHKPGTKGQHASHGGQHGGHHGEHHGSQHGGHHAGQHAAHHGTHHGTHHGAHHGSHGTHGGHHTGHHGGHHHHRGDHHDGDHHHHSASSHPFRPRRDTMLSRGHSTHHGDDKRSTGTVDVPTPVVFYENTYKMVPDRKIHEGKVREIILAVLQENIKEVNYDPSMCGQKCQLISEIIKERVKHLNMDRFKIICMVMIGQINDQSMLITSRCLWDHRYDNSVSAEFKTGNIIAVGLVFAVYTE